MADTTISAVPPALDTVPSLADGAPVGPTGRLTRGGFLRRAGLGAGSVLVAGTGVVSYRAYDQGVFQVGQGPAYDPWRTWTDGTGSERLVAAALLAPSPHNTQAWMFRLTDDRQVDIYLDPSRAVGAIDPFGRELHIGLGAALENLVLAGQADGHQPGITLMPSGPSSLHAARVDLAPGQRLPTALYRAIPDRHTNRYAYQDRGIPVDALHEISSLAGSLPNTGVQWFTSPSDRARISRALVAATEAIVGDQAQSQSDYDWFRQDWDAIQARRDGITIDASGLSDLVAAAAKILPAQSRQATDNAWLSATRDVHTKTAAAYGIVTVRDATDNAQRITGGRLFERAHLWAAANGLAFQPMNQLTERADRERQLGLTPTFGDTLTELTGPDRQALVTFRLGYPTHTAHLSPRRPVEWVVQR
jgi:nitroreductase